MTDDEVLAVGGPLAAEVMRLREAIRAFRAGGRRDDLFSCLPERPLCERCGRVLPKTKSGRLSKAKWCAPCHANAWNERNPEKIREIWRANKRKKREKAAS